MPSVRKTALAEQDLIDIWLYSFHMWSEEQAMCVTGHRSAEQMRRDYDSLQNRITRETTSRT